MRLPLLVWGMVIIAIDSLGLLALCASFLLIPASVAESWIDQSRMRWITTGVVLAVAVALWLARGSITFRSRAKVLLLTLSLLVCMSVIAYGPNSDAGFKVAGQSTARLAHVLVFFSMMAVALTSWALTEYWPTNLRVLSVAGLGVTALPLLARTAGNAAFAPLASVAAIAVILQTAALVAGLAYAAFRFYRPERGEPSLLRARWFEFGLVFLAVAACFATA